MVDGVAWIIGSRLSEEMTMKIRTDYVTNSSSSSFILAFNSKEEGCEKISELEKKYGSDYVKRLFEDFVAAEPIAYENLLFNVEEDFKCDIDWDLCFGDDWWRKSAPKTFRDRWMESHPEASDLDFYGSLEYQNEIRIRVAAMFKDLLTDIGNRGYIVSLEYEDHSRVGSELEHDILPECDFTVRRFNHH